MRDILMLPILLGAPAIDTLEAFVFLLIAAVIFADLYIGLKNPTVCIFAIIQLVGLVSGMAWAVSVGIKQDVAGPYAWALVIGVWILATALFHLWYLLRLVLKRRRLPKV